MRLGKYQQLNDFCAARLDDDFECLWQYSRLMLLLQTFYMAHFLNLPNARLIAVFNDVLLRLETFSFTNRERRVLHRLKLTIRNDILMLIEEICAL